MNGSGRWMLDLVSRRDSTFLQREQNSSDAINLLLSLIGAMKQPSFVSAESSAVRGLMWVLSNNQTSRVACSIQCS